MSAARWRVGASPILAPPRSSGASAVPAPLPPVATSQPTTVLIPAGIAVPVRINVAGFRNVTVAIENRGGAPCNVTAPDGRPGKPPVTSALAPRERLRLLNFPVPLDEINLRIHSESEAGTTVRVITQGQRERLVPGEISRAVRDPESGFIKYTIRTTGLVPAP